MGDVIYDSPPLLGYKMLTQLIMKTPNDRIVLASLSNLRPPENRPPPPAPRPHLSIDECPVLVQQPQHLHRPRLAALHHADQRHAANLGLDGPRELTLGGAHLHQGVAGAAGAAQGLLQGEGGAGEVVLGAVSAEMRGGGRGRPMEARRAEGAISAAIKPSNYARLR